MVFLKHFFPHYQMIALPSGGTDAKLYRVVSDGMLYVLKAQPLARPDESLAKERDVYAWLLGKLPVPKVKFFITHDHVEYLCMTELPGDTLENYLQIWSDEQLVTRYAMALKQLHALPLDTSVPVWTLTDRLRVAQLNLQDNAIDQDDIDPQFKHLSLHELFDEMMKIVPADFDEVCIHGDYCLDNLLFEGDALSGFIDMGRGGSGDRYHDLAISVRTIRGAFGEKMLGPFFTTYGLNSPSLAKLRFYTMLDEFY
jgi:aminoglycoside phosphotransferase